ncbi:MAG: glycosyltransferase family 2 protein, partial [Elusimicrobiota bacterium]
VAAHNAENEIRLFLESLRSSKNKDFEVCVCDDHSDDGTAAAVRGYDNEFDIRLEINDSNRGVTYTRNRAARMAKGALLLFMDADIFVAPDTIDRLCARLEESGADVVEGIYSPVALDGGLFSRYYALFAHHSFLVSDVPVEYNVFNAWCALMRREVWDKTGGHAVVEKGVEVENEAMGRRIAARGFKLLLDPAIAVDHHWGGHRKLVFIFTKRIYWWVKVFFAAGWKFESSMTTPGYGLATLCLPAALAFSVPALYRPAFWAPAVLLAACFLAGYAPFYNFARRRRGTTYVPLAVGLSAYFALFAAVSAAYSGVEELIKRAVLGRYTLSPEIF